MSLRGKNDGRHSVKLQSRDLRAPGRLEAAYKCLTTGIWAHCGWALPGPAAGSRISQGSQGPVVEQSLLSWLGEGVRGLAWHQELPDGPGIAALLTLGGNTGSCPGILPCALCPAPLAAADIVPGDPALVNVTPISLAVSYPGAEAVVLVCTGRPSSVWRRDICCSSARL